MPTPQTIAIIGTGGLASGIAAGLVNEHDSLLLFDADPEKAQRLAGELLEGCPACHAEAVGCSHTCVWEADMIILNAGCSEVERIAEMVREVANQKILLVIDAELSHVQAQFPNSRVVRAFHTVLPKDFELTVKDRSGIECAVSGNDAEALQAAAGLVRRLGFSPKVQQVSAE